MTLEEIRERIAKIEACSHDDEKAHSMEDDLLVDFIKYVATLKTPIANKAREVLKVQDLDFARYCA